MRIGFRTRERLIDGSPDPEGEVSEGLFQLRAEGLQLGATLTVSLIRGENRLTRSVDADEQGRVNVKRTVTNPRILEVLESIGAASWDCEGPWRAVAGDFTIELSV